MSDSALALPGAPILATGIDFRVTKADIVAIAVTEYEAEIERRQEINTRERQAADQRHEELEDELNTEFSEGSALRAYLTSESLRRAHPLFDLYKAMCPSETLFEDIDILRVSVHGIIHSEEFAAGSNAVRLRARLKRTMDSYCDSSMSAVFDIDLPAATASKFNEIRQLRESQKKLSEECTELCSMPSSSKYEKQVRADLARKALAASDDGQQLLDLLSSAGKNARIKITG